MQFFYFFLFIFFSSLGEKRGFSYPAYIGTGYASCLTCHYNPLGNGPVNPYGRAVQATEMSGNLFGRDLEELATNSGFVFGPLPEWLQLQGSFRGLYVGRSLQQKPTAQFILMQSEGSATIVFSKKLIASATLGYVPLPTSLSPAEADDLGNLISREHYIGILPEKGWGVYLGLMDIAFGLRVPDHNAFIRSAQLLNINDQTHGLLVHRDWQTGELAVQGFLGRLFDDQRNRSQGASLMSEFEVAEHFRLGGSFLASFSDFRERQMLASHARIQMGKGSSLLAELGLAHQTLYTFDKTSKTDSTGLFSFVQSRHLFTKGFYGLMTFETYISDFREGVSRVFRAGPSLEYLPFPKMEIRVDFFGTQVMGLSSVSPSSYSAQVQTHVWL